MQFHFYLARLDVRDAHSQTIIAEATTEEYALQPVLSLKDEPSGVVYFVHFGRNTKHSYTKSLGQADRRARRRIAWSHPRGGYGPTEG